MAAMRLPFLIRLSAAALLTAFCQAAPLEITIDPVFQGAPLRLDSLALTNAAGETLSVTRLSYLLSGFALEREDGTWQECPDTHAWMDAASGRKVINLPDIPDATYRAIRFHVGPPPADNARDASAFPASHPLNPNVNGLHWSWQGGYIFMALEGHYRTGGAEMQGYTWHLARDPNRTRITLSAPLDLHHAAGLLLQLDIASLFNAPRPLSFARDGAATHSRKDDPIAAALVANLPGAFRVHRLVSQAPALLPVTSKIKPIDLPDQFTPWRFTLSSTFPIPDLPRDNPLITERVTLGEKLFHDPILSRNSTISCASCHHADAAFTDQKPVSTGIEGRTGERNAMPLFNLAWKTQFFWDGRATNLQQQVLQPITDHREMDESLEKAASKLADSPEYRTAFQAAYRSPGITPEKIALALEQYLLTLTSYDSKLDQALKGSATLTEQEKRGFELFMTESDPRTGQRGADCFHCHGGPLFTDHQFHHNGLLTKDPGRARVTGIATDQGKFVTPSLRNIALTAPYMHDGRFQTLEEVIAHYRTGIAREPNLDPNLAKHPALGISLTDDDQAALIAFLKTLTDRKHLP
jgi:cytochrome c peroxidase